MSAGAWSSLAAAAVAAAVLGGCGLGAGSTPGAVQLTVTREFGRQLVPAHGPLSLHGQETVMSALIRNYSVGTRYGGRFVQSIDGSAGGEEGGRPVDWFYYVDGVQAPKGAASTNVRRGDRIWWDRHDWSQTEDVPAVVGSFPAPFTTGLEGRRLPVRVECAQLTGRACELVRARLHSLGVPAAAAGIGAGGAPQTLRLVVGEWQQISGDAGVAPLARGPRASGVYARLSADGRTLTPLDQDGRARTGLQAGTGMIAATREEEDAPVWVVTGTDAAGVQLAASAFDEASLRDHFAVALTPRGVVPLPEAGA